MGLDGGVGENKTLAEEDVSSCLLKVVAIFFFS